MLHFKFGMALWLFHIPLMFGDELSINGRTAFRICYNNGIGKKKHGDSIFPPVPSVGFFLAKLSDHKWIVNCSGVTCKLSDTPEQPSTKPNTKSVMES